MPKFPAVNLVMVINKVITNATKTPADGSVRILAGVQQSLRQTEAGKPSRSGLVHFMKWAYTKGEWKRKGYATLDEFEKYFLGICTTGVGPASVNTKAGLYPDVDEKELADGLLVEKEHQVTLSLLADRANTAPDYKALKSHLVSSAIRGIAMDHLKEMPDYYTRLIEMEKQQEAESPVEKVIVDCQVGASGPTGGQLVITREIYDMIMKRRDELMRPIEQGGLGHAFSFASASKQIKAELEDPGMPMKRLGQQEAVYISEQTIEKVISERYVQQLGGLPLSEKTLDQMKQTETAEKDQSAKDRQAEMTVIQRMVAMVAVLNANREKAIDMAAAKEREDIAVIFPNIDFPESYSVDDIKKEFRLAVKKYGTLRSTDLRRVAKDKLPSAGRPRKTSGGYRKTAEYEEALDLSDIR